MGRIIRIDFDIWCGYGVRVFGVVDWVTWRHLRGSKTCFAFIAGLHLWILTCRLLRGLFLWLRIRICLMGRIGRIDFGAG